MSFSVNAIMVLFSFFFLTKCGSIYPSPATRMNFPSLIENTHITKDRGSLKQDDRLDALAMVVAYWTSVMSQDADKQVEKRQEELMDMELRVFMDGARRTTDLKTLYGLGTHPFGSLSGETVNVSPFTAERVYLSNSR